jgi:Spy/CpxP family protein refolding chaperone
MKWNTKMRGLMAAALVLAALASGARAQLSQLGELKNTTPEERAAELTGLMKKELGLTPEQASKVEALNLKYAKEMEPILKGSDGPFKKMRRAREINEAKEAELQQLLTPEQLTKYQAAKGEMREEFEQRMEEKAGKGM